MATTTRIDPEIETKDQSQPSHQRDSILSTNGITLAVFVLASLSFGYGLTGYGELHTLPMPFGWSSAQITAWTGVVAMIALPMATLMIFDLADRLTAAIRRRSSARCQ